MKYVVGQVVHHRLFDYRGVVISADPHFQGTEEWYSQMARTRPPKDEPWYQVLVDNGDHMTYVAERNLEGDWSGHPVKHPLLAEYFRGYEEGKYLAFTWH